MQADERTRVVIHREWVLDTPAHHTEVAKALAVAGQKHDAETGRASDIVFTHGDDLIVIGYEVEMQHRSELGHAVDQILRAERDEWRRKAEFTMATIKRARQLAITWCGQDENALRQAGRELHETLDGPDGEAGDPE
jgi:hypothetical protein